MEKDSSNENSGQNREEIAVFCQNIKILREKYDLSKKEMAKILGIGVAGLKKLEQGIISPRASVEIIFNLSRHFKVKPNKLFISLQVKSK